MSDTPLTDAEWDRLLHLPGGGYSANPNTAGLAVEMARFAKKLERQFVEARGALKLLRDTFSKCSAPAQGGSDPFTWIYREEFAVADKVLAGANPDYVEAPMQIAVTVIDPATGEVKQGVATTEEELRILLDDERDVDAFPKAHRVDPIDDDLDEPLPPKQCGLDDPECEVCQ